MFHEFCNEVCATQCTFSCSKSCNGITKPAARSLLLHGKAVLRAAYNNFLVSEVVTNVHTGFKIKTLRNLQAAKGILHDAMFKVVDQYRLLRKV